MKGSTYKITWLFDHVALQDHVTNNAKIFYHNVYGHQTWHEINLPCGPSTHNVTLHLITWSFEIIQQIKNVVSPLSPVLSKSSHRNFLVNRKIHQHLIDWLHANEKDLGRYFHYFSLLLREHFRFWSLIPDH